MSELRSIILGSGSYLPAQILTNADLAKRVDTSDEWIVERTGIKARHIAAPEEKTSDLAIAAARAALDAAGVSGTSIDMVVLATATPDRTFPATAARVQAAIGMTSGAAFDVQAVCSGFIYALAVADNFLARGQAKRALVIGAETFSRILDWNDRSTCVLFGDGAGAVVLEAIAPSEANGRGVLATYLRADGRHEDLLYVDGGPSSTQTVGHLRMQGNQVFRHAVVNLAEAVEKVAVRAGIDVSEIDWLVPHQANRRILDGVAKKLHLPPERVVITVDQHGNTSAASIPLAFDTAVRDGRIKRGQLVLMEAMGGGFTWGAALARF
ncbi:MAG: beta-ketoacyl-ACP synthase III [Caulobacterales bacterium]